MSRKHVVIVWDREYEISVDQLSKTVWRADGAYMGKMA